MKSKRKIPIKKHFRRELASAISYNPEKAEYDDSIWKEKPVSIQKFCTKYLKEGLFPIQSDFCNAMVSPDPYEFSGEYDEGHGFWGKGSGKDRTIAKLVIYMSYKLLCLKNPQRFLREKYNCSIGDGDAIDIANMSITARQANNVFFKKFKQLLLSAKIPNTNKNWFVENGVDLREGYDLLKSQVIFPNGIFAHSLNSETHTGEGLNLFFTTLDEFGAFPVDKAFLLLDAIRETTTSRFKNFGKIAVISYHYYRNDPMHILFEEEKDNSRVYSSKAATFEVNLHVTKKDLAKFYNKNPEKAKKTYECDSKDDEGGYVTKKYMISKSFTPEYENPVVGDLISIDSAKLNNLKFKNFFKGSTGHMYCVHVDLASGKKEDKEGNIRTKANDCAGLTLLHVEKMLPIIDEKLKKDLMKEGIILEMSDKVPRKGMIIDLAIQIMARRGNEIQFSDIRNFILRLKHEFEFNIVFTTYDGWQSKDSIQILNQSGINADNLSVDKDNKAYDTWKELMYQQLVKCYPHAIAVREAKELIVNDKGKVDHPELSWDRKRFEGIEKGSKDVMDSISGAILTAFEKIPVEADVFFA